MQLYIYYNRELARRIITGGFSRIMRSEIAGLEVALTIRTVDRDDLNGSWGHKYCDADL